MRIALGQVWQETNTFNPLLTRRANFDEYGVERGSALLGSMENTNELGGFLAGLREWSPAPTPVGVIRFPAWPAGWITQDTYDWMRGEFAAALRDAMPFDGLLLALHGSMAAEGTPDVEGDLLALAREMLGPEIPIVVTLDLHAHVTPAMARHASALVLFHTIPHVDLYATGRRAAEVLRRILEHSLRPVTALARIPAVFPAERANTEEHGTPSWRIKQRLQAMEATPGVLAAGLATVQPWLDVPELGSAAVVTTSGDGDLAGALAAEIAGMAWDARDDYLPEVISVAEAVAAAYALREGLTVISDAADATTSGATGDSTWLLREMLRYRWRAPALVTMVDPEAVVLARSVGEGGEFRGELGGKRDPYSEPLPVEGRVGSLFRAAIRVRGHLGNLATDLGDAAVLGLPGEVRVVVTSRPGPHFAPELFQAAGLDPYGASLLIAKSPCGFRAAYAGRAGQILTAGAPGCAPTDYWRYPYCNRPQPLWPWERETCLPPDWVRLYHAPGSPQSR